MSNLYPVAPAFDLFLEVALTQGQLGAVAVIIQSHDGWFRRADPSTQGGGRYRYRFSDPRDLMECELRVVGDGVRTNSASATTTLQATLWQAVPANPPPFLSGIDPARRFQVETFAVDGAFEDGATTLQLTLRIDLA